MCVRVFIFLFAVFSVIWNPIGGPCGTKLLLGPEWVLKRKYFKKVIFAELLPSTYIPLIFLCKFEERNSRFASATLHILQNGHLMILTSYGMLHMQSRSRDCYVGMTQRSG